MLAESIAPTAKSVVTMEQLVSLAKRRGFIYPSSEIYGGINGFFDFGPLGCELKRNIKDCWWKDMVQRRDDMVGLDSSIIMNPKVWEASGHVGGFSDPMVDCKESKMRYRADQLYYTEVFSGEERIGYVCVQEGDSMADSAKKQAKKLAKELEKKEYEVGELRNYMESTEVEQAMIPSPATGKAGSLTAPREFNLMFQTNVGAMQDASSIAYLRPETAQGIFANFKNVVDTTRVKIPFGIAQIGKAFRNEITPRNFIFRSREFEQMEIEYFIPQGDDIWQEYHEAWIETRWNWIKAMGVKESLMGREVHGPNDLAHYAKAGLDITFQFPFGEQELEGIAVRGCYDLTQHQNASGKPLEFFDEERKEKYLPQVVEPSLGVDRLLLAILTSAYEEDDIGGEKRTVMKFAPKVAPYKAAVLPLVKNKPELVEKAHKLYKDLQHKMPVYWDASGAIGRRYRRMDEIGTPFCITVDFDTLEDQAVTVRERDSTEQKRMSLDQVKNYLIEAVDS